MDLEILHVTDGDKKRKLSTTTRANREEVKKVIERMLKKGTALFLERGRKTYRIKDYDVENDQLIIWHVEGSRGRPSQTVTAKSTKGRVTAVSPVAGG